MPTDFGNAKSSSVGDRRKSPRMEVAWGGTIVHGPDRRTAYCILLDISDGGAKLAFADITCCPDRFALQVSNQPVRDCKVIWRERRHMGVKFM